MNRIDSILNESRTHGSLCREDMEFILSLKLLPMELLRAATELRNGFSGREIRFYYPLPRFPSISVTGRQCQLNCLHCSGKYLRQMLAASSPSELFRLCMSLNQQDCTGCLISGGSDVNGCVPLNPFYSTMERVKDETDLILNVHTGLIDKSGAETLASAGIDIASADVIGSAETVRKVIGLSVTPEDYMESMSFLRESGVPNVVPHICTGLDWGETSGEPRALEMLKEWKPSMLVILAFRPTKGTPMASATAPSPETIAKIVACARLTFPSSSIALGCMRPDSQREKTEELAILAGVDRLVLPKARTLEFAVKQGLKPVHLDACCAVPTGLEKRALGQGRERPHDDLGK